MFSEQRNEIYIVVSKSISGKYFLAALKHSTNAFTISGTGNSPEDAIINLTNILESVKIQVPNMILFT
jgi:hypothetical protein